MLKNDISSLQEIAQCVAKTNLTVNGDILGFQDTYELISYIDEVVILDSLGQEIVSIPRKEISESD